MTQRATSQHRPAAIALAAALLCLGAAAGCSRESGQASGPGEETPAAECGRDCLIDLLDRYLAAVLAHDPDAAPLADDFRATQNARPTAIGEGVWTSATALGALQRRYADGQTGQAGYVGLLGEGASTAIVSLRISVEDRRITEAEWVIARDETPLYNPAGFTANPPPEEVVADGAPPVTRDAAIAAVESYYDGIEAADASAVIAAPDCFRLENGSWMVGRIPERAEIDPADAQPGYNIALLTGPDAVCVGGFQNFRNNIRAVAGRRYFFDDVAGVLWATVVFERAEGAADRNGQLFPWVYLTNIFRIEDGRIQGIHAVSHRIAVDALPPEWPGAQ